jgi:hypothetical protein
LTDGAPLAGRGWSALRPIESPMPKGSFVDRVVGGMIDRALGPAVPKAGDKAFDVEP